MEKFGNCLEGKRNVQKFREICRRFKRIRRSMELNWRFGDIGEIGDI